MSATAAPPPAWEGPPPHLRPDLVISRQEFSRKVSYVVKDPISLRYLRLGQFEIFVAGLLNGKRSFEDIVRIVQKRYPGEGHDGPSLMGLLNLLARMNCLQLEGRVAEHILLERKAQRDRGSWAHTFHEIFNAIFFFRVTLLDPEQVLIRLERRVRFMWSRGAVIFLGLLVVCALSVVAANFDRVTHQAADFLTLHNLFWLWLVLVAVKIVHEFGHGLTCKHFGGEVHAIGALFIVFTPFMYCDATDAWMFRSKWHKLAVNLGGIYFELFLAGFATFVWALTQPGLVNQLALNVMTVCSVVTIMFNANPLLRFDGYYVLADWSEIPNLRERARGLVMNFFMSLVTWEWPEPALPMSLWRKTWFSLYALLSYFYGWFVIYNIIHIIGIKLEPYGLAGAGQTLEGVFFLVGMSLPVIAFVRQLVFRLRAGDSSLRRRLVLFSVGLLLVASLLVFLPWSSRIEAGCVLGNVAPTRVHALVPGFVKAVHVQEGALVRSGDPIFTLENLELSMRLQDARLHLESIQISKQAALAMDNASAYQGVLADEAQLKSLYRSIEDELKQLTVRSDVDGVVLTAEMSRFLGFHVREGDAVCEVMPAEKCLVVIPISESEAGTVHVGATVKVRMYAFPDRVFSAEVTKVFTSVSDELAHPALSSRSGGEVATTVDRTGKERPTLPTYQAEVTIDNPARLLRIGMTGRVKIQGARTTVGHALVGWLRRIVHLDFQM